jgi:hypothetical protein
MLLLLLLLFTTTFGIFKIYVLSIQWNVLNIIFVVENIDIVIDGR